MASVGSPKEKSAAANVYEELIDAMMLPSAAVGESLTLPTAIVAGETRLSAVPPPSV
jgi:hypothetical protein